MNFLLTEDGDLDLTGGRLNTIDGPEEVQQAVRVAILTFKGEDEFNPASGIDYRGLADEKGDVVEALRDEVRRVVTGVAGVLSIDRLEVSVDGTTRRATVEVDVHTVDGSVAYSEVFPL